MTDVQKRQVWVRLSKIKNSDWLKATRWTTFNLYLMKLCAKIVKEK